MKSELWVGVPRDTGQACPGRSTGRCSGRVSRAWSLFGGGDEVTVDARGELDGRTLSDVALAGCGGGAVVVDDDSGRLTAGRSTELLEEAAGTLPDVQEVTATTTKDPINASFRARAGITRAYEAGHRNRELIAARLSAQLHAWDRHGPAGTPDLTSALTRSRRPDPPRRRTPSSNYRTPRSPSTGQRTWPRTTRSAR